MIANIEQAIDTILQSLSQRAFDEILCSVLTNTASDRMCPHWSAPQVDGAAELLSRLEQAA
jgi:hypothetical protein